MRYWPRWLAGYVHGIAEGKQINLWAVKTMKRLLNVIFYLEQTNTWVSAQLLAISYQLSSCCIVAH